VKSKSVTNLAEATADPALDQPGGLNQIEIHPLADGVGHINLNGDGGPRNIPVGGRVVELHPPAAPILHQNPPGSPLLRMHMHHEPNNEPGLPPDEAP